MAKACDSSTSDESCGPPTSRYGERAYYKAYLSHPVEMASIIEFLGKLHPWGRVQELLPPRWKEGGGEHLNPEVGRVKLVLAGSAATFEYGVTDVQPGFGGRKQKLKRKVKTYHMYVLACGSLQLLEQPSGAHAEGQNLPVLGVEQPSGPAHTRSNKELRREILSIRTCDAVLCEKCPGWVHRVRAGVVRGVRQGARGMC